MKKRRSNQIILLLIIVFAFATLIILPSPAVGALSGAIDYSYNIFVSKDPKARTRTGSFSQSYDIGKNGLLLSNKNIGTYAVGFGYSNSKSSSSSRTTTELGDSHRHTENSSDNYTYNVSSGIFPASFSPVTFSFSRHLTEFDNSLNPTTLGTAFKSKTETDSYRGTWRIITKRRLPTMTTSLSLVDSDSESEFNQKDERRRKVKFDVTKGGLRTMYRLNYDYEDFLDKSISGETKARTESHATSINFNRRMSRRMTLNTTGSYNNSAASESFNFGSNLSKKHRRNLDSSYSYNFSLIDSRAQDAALAKSHRLAARVRFSPFSRLSLNGSSAFQMDDTTKSLNLNTGIGYKITERWHSTASMVFYGAKRNSEMVYRHSDNLTTNYSRPFKYIQFGSSYSYSFSWQEQGLSGSRATGKSKTHSASMTFTSQTLKKVGISSGIRASKTTSSSSGEGTSGSEGSSASLSINTSAIKYVGISGSVGYSNTVAAGRRNQTLTTGASTNLSFIKGLSTSVAFNLTRNMPSDGPPIETQSFSVSSAGNAPLAYTKRITRNLTFKFTAKYTVNQITKSNVLSQALVVGPVLTYKIGKLSFSLDYKFSENKTKSEGVKTYSGHYNTMLKLTRRF